MGFHKTFGGSGTDTSDATAQQWHIKNGKTAYLASGKVTGNAYTPAMMKFDGSTAGYTKTFTKSGDLVTVVARFNRASFSGNTSEILTTHLGSSSQYRCHLEVYSSDFTPEAARAGKLICIARNAAGVNLCKILSNVTVCDGTNHTIQFAFNATTGTPLLRIDGSDADDLAYATRVANTGALDAGSGLSGVGSNHLANAGFFSGQIGYYGYHDAYLTNWSDFMRSDGSPIAQEESGSWGGWGAQPLFWNEHGQMDNNLGSAGNMTRNGTIVIGKGGNT